jgi:cell wall-associated NlpC family hydrolase
LTAEQTANARIIADVAYRLGLGERGAQIGITVALTESTLINVGYGDLDSRGQMTSSRGILQQKSEWGSLADRLDPAKAATMFYTGGHAGQNGLMDIPGWEAMPIPAAAQAVQHSGFPTGSNYAKQLTKGLAVTAALGCGSVAPATGTDVQLPDSPFIAVGLRGAVLPVPNERVAAALRAGLRMLGTPYGWGQGNANGPTNGSFDCSGLMQYVWAQAGLNAPRNSQVQARSGQQVPWAQRLPGDMLGTPTHVAMFVATIGGVDFMLEAPYTGSWVRIAPVRSHYPNVARIWNVDAA